MATIDTILKNDLGVGQNYEHGPKRATPGEAVETNGAGIRNGIVSKGSLFVIS
jgi:hypothetical protein